MSLTDEAKAYEAVRRPVAAHPDGWTPGIEWDGKVGRITSRPIAEANPDWTHLLETWGFDPAQFEIVEPVQVRTWDAAIGNGEVRTMWYHRAGIRQRRTAGPDVAELIASIAKHKPRPLPSTGEGGAFIYVMSDCQLGKKGTEATIERVLASYGAAAARIKQLRKSGSRIERLYFLTLGDLVEGCKDHYCVTVDTPVLTGDLRWVPAGSLSVGDPLYALTEEPVSRRGRRYEAATVTHHVVEAAEVVRVTFDNGESMTCTPEHPFLAAKTRTRGVQGSAWVAAQDLTPDHHVAKMFDVWSPGESYDHGWLGGIYDGEGHFSAGHERSGPNILGVSQLPGPVLDRIKALLGRFGFTFTDDDGKGRPTSSATHSLRIRGGYPEVLRLLGTMRPDRLIRKLGYPMAQAKEWPRVVSVEPAGVQMIARMSTSSRTFFAAGYAAHNSMQTFEVELDKRAQVRTARRLVLKGIETLAPMFAEVVLAGVGGNHGENRSDGKAFTTFADNADVEVIETAAEVLAAAPAYQHVRSVIPNDQLAITLDIAGTITALAHGHQARRGTTPQAKVKEWWKGQAFGMRPAGDASLLLTGHSHHLSIVQDGPRTHIQAPTIDSGSQWWEESAGIPSIPAALTLTIGPKGWDDLKLL